MQYINRHNKVTKQFGFSLWELSIVMLIMIGLFVALVSVMPYIVKRENVEVDKSILFKIDEQLLGFVATHARLPCPDVAPYDGNENCGTSNSTGAIPYKALGLNEDYAGVGSIPVQYAVYRNTTNATSPADLANITNLFNPTDSHGTVTTINNINGLDFCTAIANGKASTFSSAFAHISFPDTTTRSVPYVLATAGLANKDGGTSPFDGLNATAALDFESANRAHDAEYDDTVFTKSFDELADTLNCDTAQRSLNLMADGKATHEENLAQADNLEANAELAAIITGAQILLGIANTAMAAFTLAAAVTTLATASSLLAGAIASCVVLVGCALIPVYTAGVVASTVAIVAAGVAVGLNVAALIAQAVALGLVIDVALRAGAQISLPEESTDPNDPNATMSNEELAIEIRQQAEDLKLDAAEKVISARDQINRARGSALTIRNRFNTIKAQTQLLEDSRIAINDGLFNSYSLSADSQAATNVNQATTAYNNTVSARNNANDAVSALGAQANSGFPFFQISYPNVNFPLAESHLNLADPKMTTAATNINNLKNSYLNILTQATNARNRANTLIANQPARPVPADPANPTAAETQAMADWDALRDAYILGRNRAQNVMNTMNALRDVFISDLIDRRDGAVDAYNEVVDIISNLAPIPDEPVPADPANPTAQETAALVNWQNLTNERADLLVLLNGQLTEQLNLINYYNGILNGPFGGFLIFEINRLQDDIQIGVGRIDGARAQTTEAFETINSALDAEENAAYFEANVGNGLPNPNGTLNEQAAGVDDILADADAKGAER